MKKLSPKQQDREIERIYKTHCSGMQINMMRIPELFRKARGMLASGATFTEIGAFMVAFVNAERSQVS